MPTRDEKVEMLSELLGRFAAKAKKLGRVEMLLDTVRETMKSPQVAAAEAAQLAAQERKLVARRGIKYTEYIEAGNAIVGFGLLLITGAGDSSAPPPPSLPGSNRFNFN